MSSEVGPSFIEKFVELLLEEGQKRGWHQTLAKCGLLGSQNLLVHSLNAATIGWRLADVAKKSGVNLDNTEIKVLVGALAVHDFAKAYGWRCGLEAPRNALTPEEKESALDLLKSTGLSEEEAKQALDLSLQCEDPVSGEDVVSILGSRSFRKELVDLCSLADAIASIKSLRTGLCIGERSLNRAKRLGITLTYHRVCSIRGLTTQLLHSALINIHERAGFQPIAYFPDGVVYAAPSCKEPIKEIDEKELTQQLEKELFTFLDSTGKLLADAALGQPTATAVKVPEYALISEDTNKRFWNRVAHECLRLAERRKIRHEPYLREKLDARGLDPDAAQYLSKFTAALHWLFVYLNSMLESLEKARGEEVDIILDRIANSFKVSHKLAKDVASLANTTKTQKAVNILFEFITESIISEENDLLSLISEEKAKKVFNQVVLAVKDSFLPLIGKTAILDKFRSQVRALVNDVVYPRISSQDLIQESLERLNLYSSGKKRANPICVICGAKTTVEGISSLHGDGVESFNNFLLGGTSIEGGRKVRFCSTCDLESKLRKILLKEAENVLILVPQLQASWAISEEWWRSATDYLSVLAKVIDPHDVEKLSNLLLDGGPALWKSVYSLLIRKIAESGRNSRAVVRNLAEVLEENYPELSTLSYLFNQGFSSYEEAARWILENNALDELSPEVKSSLTTRARWAVGFISSNYMVVLTGSIGQKDEPEVAKLIRLGFFSTFLARALLGTTVLPDIPLQVLGPELVVRGYSKLPGELLLRKILWETLGLDSGWIPIERVDEILVRLAALIRADSLMRKYRAVGVPYGRDNLIQLAKRPPGQALVRAAGQMSSEDLKELARCLRLWWEGPASKNGPSKKAW